jgi:hypothetical protein
VPSAGTITLQIELYAARVPTAPALRTSVRWFQRISSYGKAKAMQVPSAVKPACWGAVGGAIALAIIGFHWGGWMTSHAAGKFADERADVAVVAALTPICVDKFQHDADAAANLDDRFHETAQLELSASAHKLRYFRGSHMIRILEALA